MPCHPDLPFLRRAPWLVKVHGCSALHRRFSFSKRRAAEAYREQLRAQGFRAKLEQVGIAFPLRSRRKGLRDPVATVDPRPAAEQDALRAVRDDVAAARDTLAALMQRYIVEVAPRHKGGEVEICRLRRLIRDEEFVGRPLAALTTEDLQQFVCTRLDTVAPATVDRELDVIAQVLRYAHEVWSIAAAERPMQGLRRPKCRNERDRRLMPGEEERLLAAAREHENPYVEAAIILALETAMRRNELLSLQPEDIDYAGRFIRLPATTRGRTRKVPLSMRAAQVLQALPATDDGRMLALSANALKQAFFEHVIPLSGIKDLTFRDLRREALSRWAESGVFDRITLPPISLYFDPRRVLRYAHRFPRQFAETLDRRAPPALGDYRWDGYKRRLRRGRRAKPVKADVLAAEARLWSVPPASVEEEANNATTRAAPASGGGPAVSPVSAQVIDFAAMWRRRRP